MKRYEYTLLESTLEELERDLNAEGNEGGRLIHCWPDPSAGTILSVIMKETSGEPTGEDNRKTNLEDSDAITLESVRDRIQKSLRPDGMRLDYLAKEFGLDSEIVQQRLNALGLNCEQPQVLPDGETLSMRNDARSGHIWVNLKVGA